MRQKLDCRPRSSYLITEFYYVLLVVQSTGSTKYIVRTIGFHCWRVRTNNSDDNNNINNNNV
jgi:hypothetical protein